MLVSKPPHCSAVNCSNNRGENPGLSFFTFPKNRDRSTKWAINSGREDLLQKASDYLCRNCRLCAMHFEENQFMNKNRNSLIKTAVPTIFTTNDCPEQLGNRKQATVPNNESTLKSNYIKGCDGNSNRKAEITKTAECVLQPVMIKDKVKESEECTVRKGEGVGEETDKTTENMKQLHSLLHTKKDNLIKDMNAAEGNCEQCTDPSETDISSLLSLLKQKTPIEIDMSQYKCNICSKTFIRPSCLSKHKLSKHSGQQKYQCNICNATFSQSGNLSQHKLLVHYENKRYQCHACTATFTDLKDFQQHDELMHTDKEIYQCDICNKTFTNLDNLSQHKFRKSKKYQCDICYDTFSFCGALSKHKLIHPDARKHHRCKVCKKRFSQSYNYSVHQLRHVFNKND